MPDVKFLLILAAKFDLELVQYDVKTALNKLVYIEIPDGYTQYLQTGDNRRKNNVCKVHRALYGLKVSPKRWFIRFQEAVRKNDNETAIMLL